jgi:hypothetical protein
MLSKDVEIRKYSNPATVRKRAKEYFGSSDIKVELSTKNDKKYMIKVGNRTIHFGQMLYEDFTKHRDVERRNRYLARSTKIKGDWKKDIYSPNNLSIHLLW